MSITTPTVRRSTPLPELNSRSPSAREARQRRESFWSLAEFLLEALGLFSPLAWQFLVMFGFLPLSSVGMLLLWTALLMALNFALFYPIRE